MDDDFCNEQSFSLFISLEGIAVILGDLRRIDDSCNELSFLLFLSLSVVVRIEDSCGSIKYKLGDR